MRVTILDLDWYNNLSFVPNPTCMRLSSFYKQSGYSVNFATKQVHLTLAYDILYIVREKMSGSVPECINIRDKRVKLLGKAFRFFGNYVKQLDDAILMCRPDYTLYDLPLSNRLAGASFVQFYGSDGLLPGFQDFHTAYEKAKDIVVSDVDFWSKKIEDVRYCVELLKKEKNIVFSHPISLKNLVKDEERIKLLLSLNLKLHYGWEFVNDCGFDDYPNIINFIRRFKDTFVNVTMKPIEFKFWRKGYSDIDNIRYGFELAAAAKEKRAHIILKAPDRLECALWDYYENLEAWSKIDFQSSYVDFVFGVQHTVGGRDYFALANNELYWSLPITQNLADICRRDWSIIKNYGFLTWGGKMDKFVDLSKTLRIKEN